MNTNHSQSQSGNNAIEYPLLQTTTGNFKIITNDRKTTEIQSKSYLNEPQRSLPTSLNVVDNTQADNQKASKYNALVRFFTNHRWHLSFYEQNRSRFTVDYIRNNVARIIFLIFYILINLGLTLYVVIFRSTVTKDNVLVIFARIGGMLLNFNCTLVIILMLKYTILMVRSNKYLRKWIPTDDHIDFHKFVGRFIAVLVFFHTVSHMINFGLRTEHSWAEFIFTTHPDIGWVGGFTPISGMILCITLSIIIICSMKWIRRGGHFQIFYWTHLLYLIFYILLIIHAKPFWKWIIVPFSLLLLEKIYSNLTRYSSNNGRTHILSVTIEPSNVICLYIHRPKYFRFKAGDYISINLPSIAFYEYHPFTISSAPEEMSYLSVHIQVVGDWTKQVYQHFKNISDSQSTEYDLTIHRADLNIDQAKAEERQEWETIHQEEENNENERIVPDSRLRTEMVIIKGPYSSSARCVFDCKHVILIGGGIGITPYASILQSLMAQFRASRIVCKHCQGINYNRRCMIENRCLKKVDFIWVNRNHRNFEWFLNILHQFELEQETYLKLNTDEQRFLDIHLHFTGIKSNQHIGNSSLDLITKVWTEITGHDVFTALKSKTRIGRPNWNELFQTFKFGENASTANDVGVFFCGPPSMGTDIHKYCIDYQFKYFEEKF